VGGALADWSGAEAGCRGVSALGDAFWLGRDITGVGRDDAWACRGGLRADRDDARAGWGGAGAGGDGTGELAEVDLKLSGHGVLLVNFPLGDGVPTQEEVVLPLLPKKQQSLM